MIAHGVSRGTHVQKAHQPQRGDRRGRLPCTETSREDARPGRSHGVVSRRDAENAEGEGGCLMLPASCLANANGVETPSKGWPRNEGNPEFALFYKIMRHEEAFCRSGKE